MHIGSANKKWPESARAMLVRRNGPRGKRPRAPPFRESLTNNPPFRIESRSSRDPVLRCPVGVFYFASVLVALSAANFPSRFEGNVMQFPSSRSRSASGVGLYLWCGRPTGHAPEIPAIFRGASKPNQTKSGPFVLLVLASTDSPPSSLTSTSLAAVARITGSFMIMREDVSQASFSEY